MDKFDLAHKESRNNKQKLINDIICGCFYCKKIFNAKEIKDWIDSGNDTALCPYCGIDSVIGESNDLSITEEFLKEMHDRWFNSNN